MDAGQKILVFLDAIQRLTPILMAVTFGLVVFVCITEFRKKLEKRQTQLKKASKEKARGIIFGKQGFSLVYSPTQQEGHVAVFGGSGLGKTSALLIPTLRSWNGTSFTIDISGDICKNVNMQRKMIYEPANPNSVPYNIFGTIDQMEDEDDRNEALEEIAFLLMPDDERMSDTSKFFQVEGRKILTAALIAFYHVGMDFIPICEKVVRSGWKELFQAIDGTGYEKAIQYINSFEGTSEQNTAGCKQSCDIVLKLFATNEKVKKTIRRPHAGEKDFLPARIENHNVFVVVEDSKLKIYAPLLHIITAQSLEYFSQRSSEKKQTILFCLDEFASFGKMEITDALRKLRKKRIRIMMLTQSMADIDLIYGRDERMAMMNNYRFKVVLGASDTDTQEYFAKLIGYQDTKKYSKSRNASQTTQTESEVKEWAIEPAELDRLKKDLVLLHPDGYMRLKKNYYYK